MGRDLSHVTDALEVYISSPVGVMCTKSRTLSCSVSVSRELATGVGLDISQFCKSRRNSSFKMRLNVSMAIQLVFYWLDLGSSVIFFCGQCLI